MAGTFLLRWDTQGDVVPRPPSGAFLPTTLNSNQAEANILKTSFWEQAFPSAKEMAQSSLCVLFLNNQLQINIPKGSLLEAKVWFPFKLELTCFRFSRSALTVSISENEGPSTK